MNRNKTVALLPFMIQFIEDTDARITGIAKSANRNYKSTLVRLKGYCTSRNVDLNFEDIDFDFYDDFKCYLLNEGHYKISGFNKHIKILKAIMRLTMDNDLHNNLAFQHKLFRKIPVKTNKTYLSVAEIELLDNVDLTD